jgi:hypothetical protein
LIAAAAACRELNDHSRAMLLHAFLNLLEELRVGRRAFVWITHVNVHQGSASLEGFVRGFDLLRNRHR